MKYSLSEPPGSWTYWNWTYVEPLKPWNSVPSLAQKTTSNCRPRVKRGQHATYAMSVPWRDRLRPNPCRSSPVEASKWVTTTKPKCDSGRELKIETQQLAAIAPITCPDQMQSKSLRVPDFPPISAGRRRRDLFSLLRFCLIFFFFGSGLDFAGGLVFSPLFDMIFFCVLLFVGISFVGHN